MRPVALSAACLNAPGASGKPFPDMPGQQGRPGRGKMKRFLIHALILGYVGLLLAACAGADIPDAKPTTGRNPEIAETPSAKESVRGEDDPPIVTLELGSALHANRLTKGDDLPGNIIIPTTNLKAVPITAALQAVLAGTDVSLSWNTGSLADNLVTVVNLSGPLPKVVDRICAAGKVFCSFHNGSIELAERETFVVSIPPIARGAGTTGGAAGNTMVETITQLSGGKAQIDDQGGNIIYTTDVAGQERVSQYLEQLRNGRPLVVLQFYIWEVTLNKQNSEGVNWSEFKIGHIPLPGIGQLATSSLSSFANVSGDSVSLGAITTGHVNSNSVFQFLSTQGRVQTISNPQVTFVSGSSAKFVAGGEQSYISSVGQLVSATNVSGTNNASSTTGVGTNTINLDKIKTGLTLDINGAYENGVVFANMDLNLINLVSLATATGTIVQTPITSNRAVNTVIRVRPGDNPLMAGMVTSADTNTREGIPLPGDDNRLPTYGNDQLSNNELVIMVKPSIVLFSDKMQAEETKAKEQAKPLPDAVLIDKDGPKTLVLPAESSATTSTTVSVSSAAAPLSSNSTAAPTALPAPATAMTTTTTSTTTSSETLSASAPIPLQETPLQNAPMPLTATTEDAPVDRRLMQRGFSHAFDDLLQPMPTHLSSGSEATQ